ncbi:oxidoreductase, short chain dehydrogenase/reductase family [Hyphomonas neptunium ATCC 15444]|uniref:Oxidoreductase, short chain dehydrogenase/reductase family n=2 Tax=Hyphomonas TaxID=85 RepID=Q0C051_HYPNA|nr:MULTISPECIES: SDR family NAD(P)-dependent oxidoreductase [Hyphomonas]ABI77797.1 oxidoreductase, short chain dehydrogenase/reductase family [Hyphomonas neptunium ATCC 15444]KCZ90525.1 short chain dehydrogenase/reductase family oxidoreductase [Hyphomonas hirschiana VP5]
MTSPQDYRQTPPEPDHRGGGLSRRSLLGMAAIGTTIAAVGIGGTRLWTGSSEIPDWTYKDIPPQNGRRVLVTGANGYPEEDRSGLGYHIALGLARAGADVIIASRNQTRGEEAIRRIGAESPAGRVRFETLDLADLKSVKDFTARMQASGNGLDLLVNNAGTMGTLERQESIDGFERVFATNAIGPFALTAGLLPLLRNGNAPRIVWMCSGRSAFGALDLDDLQQENAYEYASAYNDSKQAHLIAALECERRSRAHGWGVVSIAAHPGVARTSLILDGPGLDSAEGWRRRNMPFMFQDAAQGALPALYAAVSSQAAGGAYYGPKGLMGIRGLPGVSQVPDNSRDPQLATTVWETLEQLGTVSLR